MDEGRLAAALAPLLGPTLAVDLTAGLIRIRRDCATRTLERSAPGKFVESFVQCLQYIDSSEYDENPSVDAYLRQTVENTSLPDGLRICAARVARAMYTLRNKRNIAHKNEVDPNTHDLALVHQSAAWIVAELLRHATGVSMEEAGAVVELVQAPVGTLVEEIDGTMLVHADVPIRTEILILLHSRYPEVVPAGFILSGLSRRNAGSVRNRLRELHSEKLVHGGTESGFRLTQTGYTTAVSEIEALSG